MAFPDSLYDRLAGRFSSRLLHYEDEIAVLPPALSVPRLLYLISRTLETPLLFVSAVPGRLLAFADAFAREGFAAFVLLREDSRERIQNTLDAFSACEDRRRILLIEPELLLLFETRHVLRGFELFPVILDEAHRASFRDPDFSVRYHYLMLAERKYAVRFPILALSEGTDLPENRFPIADTLGFSQVRSYRIPGNFRRAVLRVLPLSEEERPETILRLCRSSRGRSVVLCAETSAEADEAFSLLTRNGFSAVCCHTARSAREGCREASRFVRGECSLAVCTEELFFAVSARPVDVFVRLSMPRSLPAYARTVLEALRHDKRVMCYLLYQQNDIRSRTEEAFRRLIYGDYALPDPEVSRVLLDTAVRAVEKAAAFCESDQCLMLPLTLSVCGKLPARGKDIVCCGYCSSCDPVSERKDVTEEACQILRCMKRHGYREPTLIRYLRGETPEREKNDSFWGSMRICSESFLKSLIRRLETDRFVEPAHREDRYFPYPTALAGCLLDGSARFYLPQEQIGPFSLEEQRLLSENADTVVVRALRALRLDLARENGRMPFEIFGTFTLHALGVLLPETPDALARVPRLPKETFKTAGSRILAVIRKNRTK